MDKYQVGTLLGYIGNGEELYASTITDECMTAFNELPQDAWHQVCLGNDTLMMVLDKQKDGVIASLFCSEYIYIPYTRMSQFKILKPVPAGAVWYFVIEE